MDLGAGGSIPLTHPGSFFAVCTSSLLSFSPLPSISIICYKTKANDTIYLMNEFSLVVARYVINLFIFTENISFAYICLFVLGLSLISFTWTIYFLLRTWGERSQIRDSIRKCIKHPVLLNHTVSSADSSKSFIKVIPLLYAGIHLTFFLFLLLYFLYITPIFIQLYILFEAGGLPYGTRIFNWIIKCWFLMPVILSAIFFVDWRFLQTIVRISKGKYAVHFCLFAGIFSGSIVFLFYVLSLIIPVKSALLAVVIGNGFSYVVGLVILT